MFSRLKHFIVHGQAPSAYAVPRGREATLQGGGSGGPFTAARGRKGGRKGGGGEPAKLLRRPTNRQQYPTGLKTCLRAWAEAAFAAPPLQIDPQRFDAPLLALPHHYDHHEDGHTGGDRGDCSSGGGGDCKDRAASAALFALGEGAWGSAALPLEKTEPEPASDPPLLKVRASALVATSPASRDKKERGAGGILVGTVETII